MNLRNPTRYMLFLFVPVVLLANPGCAQPAKEEGLQQSQRINAPNTDDQLNPAQRRQAFRRAYNEGLRLASKQKYGLALGAFEKAVTLRPDSTEALFNLGACHEALGDPMRAIGIYRRIVRLTPNDPDCYANLGTSYVKMYYRDNSPAWRRMARDAWRHSLQLNPDQPDVKRFLKQTESFE